MWTNQATHLPITPSCQDGHTHWGQEPKSIPPSLNCLSQGNLSEYRENIRPKEDGMVTREGNRKSPAFPIASLWLVFLQWNPPLTPWDLPTRDLPLAYRCYSSGSWVSGAHVTLWPLCSACQLSPCEWIFLEIFFLTCWLPRSPWKSASQLLQSLHSCRKEGDTCRPGLPGSAASGVA